MSVVDEQLINAVRSSYGRCITHKGFMDTFYDIFTKKSPIIGQKFKNTDFVLQKEALKKGLGFMLLFAKGSVAGKAKIELLAKSHSKAHLDISPALYPMWMDSLLEAVSEHDKEFTPELKEQWKQVIKPGMDAIIEGYNA